MNEQSMEGLENIIKGLLDEQIKKEIEKTAEDLEEEWRELQVAAKNFLNAVQELDWASLAEDNKNKIKTLQQNTLRFDDKLIREAQVAKKFYEKLFEFDEKLTTYLGEPPKRALFVVTNSKGIPETYEMSLKQLASLSQGHGRLGNLNRKNLISLEQQIKKTNKELFDHVQKGQCAVQGVNNRLNRFYENRGVKTKDGNIISTQRQGGLLMWRTGGGWKIVRIINQGIIDEAYTHFLLTKHKTPKDYLQNISVGNAPYYNHSLINQFFRYFKNVTNEQASLKEDVYRTWGQYAVKGAKAALPSADQYIKQAEKVLSYNEISPQELKKQLEEDIVKHNAQLATLVKKGIKNLPDELNQLLIEQGFKKANIKAMIR